MIFVYPSVISENVPEYLYPAIAKTLEQFYLFHLLESFGNGTLRVKSVYQPSKQVYGPLVLESKLDNSPMVIMEDVQFGRDDATLRYYFSGKGWENDLFKIDQFINRNIIPYQKEFNDEILKDAPVWERYLDNLINEHDEISRLIDVLTMDITRTARQTILELDDNIRNENKKKDKDISKINTWNDHKKDIRNWLARLDVSERELNRMRANVKNKIENAKIQISRLSSYSKDDPKYSKLTKKDELERKERKAREKAAQAQRHASYTVRDVGSISLQPTMSNIRVKIQYVGGPAEGAGSAKDFDYQDLVIGAKVVPMKVTNFDQIQNAILNDYFSNRVSLFFKSKTRGLLRGIFKFVERGIKRIAGKDVELSDMINDPVYKMIYLSPQGFVDASSFKRRPDIPSFYNFSSASVVFVDSDMTYEGGENFFKNKSKLNQMFKAGWNTFVVLKEIEEIIYFISSLDGGSLHIFPYSYMFNALKMDKVYDSDEFKRRSRGFQVRSGNMGTLASRLARENRLYENARRALQDG